MKGNTHTAFLKGHGATPPKPKMQLGNGNKSAPKYTITKDSDGYPELRMMEQPGVYRVVDARFLVNTHVIGWDLAQQVMDFKTFCDWGMYDLTETAKLLGVELPQEEKPIEVVTCPECEETVNEGDYSKEHDMCQDCLTGALETTEDAKESAFEM